MMRLISSRLVLTAVFCLSCLSTSSAFPIAAYRLLSRTSASQKCFESLSYTSKVTQLIMRATTSTIDPASVTAEDLRSIAVTNVDGSSVELGSAMGTGTSIVVFLRHLGCFWCWSYARAWTQLQEEIASADDITGPIFVSIGDPMKLNDFLLDNEKIPRDQIFVDGYDFEAFKQAGFGRFDEKPKELIENVKPQPIELGGIKGWWTFLNRFMTLAPVTEDMKFPENFSPEGLYWVGGTFVVKGDEIVYRWNDRISGDHADPKEVLNIAKAVAAKEEKAQPFRKGSKSGSSTSKFLGLFSWFPNVNSK